MLLGVFEKFQLNFQLDFFMMFWAESLLSKSFASSPCTSLTCSKYLEGSLHQAVCVGKKKERLRNTSIRMYVTKCKKRGDFFKWISKSSWNTVIEPDGETWNLFPESSKNFPENFSNIWKTHWSWIFASAKYFDRKTCYDDFKACFEKFSQD